MLISFFSFSASAKLKCASISPPVDESRRKHGSMRSLIYIDMDSAMTWCLLGEILVFCHQMFSFFLFLLDSVICRKMEKYLPLLPHLQLKLNEPLSQSARVQQQHEHCVRQKSVSSVNVAVIVRRKKKLQTHFPQFSAK